MQKRLYQLMLLLALTALVMAAASTAYADDGTTEPTGGEEQTTEEVTPSETVEEILEQIPENTELVVVSEEGVEPLASEAAAEIILEADPIWCPSGQNPGNDMVDTVQDCTDSYTTVTALIDNLGSYSGAGTIYFTSTYATNDAVFDQTNTNLANLTDVTIQGGWNGGFDGGYSLSGVTTFSGVSFTIANWTGNITINDIVVDTAGHDAGFGLFIENTGTVVLNNVSVNDTPENSYFVGDGAIIQSTGDVSINGSYFDGNEGNGLQVSTTGAINLNTVSASGNTLTGAYLDSCLYGDVTPGLCAGSGAVTITSASGNLFNGNGFPDGASGLIINSGGAISIDHTQASNNALNGAVLTSADDNGTGDVSISSSAFNGNSNGTGLDVLTDGSITLATITAYGNRTGAILDTIDGTGNVNIADADFWDGSTDGNIWTGLHVESGGLIDLENVTASYNGSNGAYLIAEGNIDVDNSTFDENVNSNFPEDPGLFAKSHNGAITINNVLANGNEFGAGAVLKTGSGAINVTGGQYNTNGTIGLQAQAGGGNITINGILASLNDVKGAYLSTYDTGNIDISNSTFNENGSYGIYASASEGNVTSTGDTVDGNGITGYGAVLSGTDVTVTGSAFNNNTDVGLTIIASGIVQLDNVEADFNGGNGVEVYSTYTDGPICPGEEAVHITVNVTNNSAFTNNGNYGLMVKPGPEGTLNIDPSTSFLGNGNIDNYLLDLAEPEVKNCDEEKEETEPKDPKVVQVPPTGGIPVEQECDLFSSTVLELPNGSWVNVGCPFDGFSNLEEVLQDNLPGRLGAGTNFVSAVTVSLTDEDGNPTLNEDGTITLNFKIPEDSRGRGYAILFWDPTLNNGEGGWVEMPLFEFGTSFRLNPGDPDDPRTIISGVQQVGDVLTITVNFPGVFVLVER